eukprot:4885653-Pleurochrysis_carterae.AAC.1
MHRGGNRRHAREPSAFERRRARVRRVLECEAAAKGAYTLGEVLQRAKQTDTGELSERIRRSAAVKARPVVKVRAGAEPNPRVEVSALTDACW